MVLGVDFWSGFGPVSAMKTGLFGPGNRTKSPVSAVKTGLFGPGNRTQSPIFRCDFGEKAEKSSFSRREIELFEKRNRAFRGGFSAGACAGRARRPLFRSRLLIPCNARQCWSPVVVTTQSVGLCERVRSHNACMYPYQPSGKIRSVVVAHQSENGIDDRARAAVSPSTGHAAAPIFRM